VNLCNGEKNQVKVHRLVANAFIPNPDDKKNVNHKDGNKVNNIVSNLEWCTHTENNRHAFAMNLKTALKGENHASAKLKESEVLEILKYKGTGIKHKEISKIFGVSQRTIGNILRGARWKHLNINQD
jgi:DNA-directed RNA polymerase specialized sigma24 family protein